MCILEATKKVVSLCRDFMEAVLEGSHVMEAV